MTTPAELFATLWRRLQPREAEIVGRPWAGRHAAESADLHRLLEAAAGPEVPDAIGSYLADEPVPFHCTVADLDERAFVVMCALDDVAILIHPAFANRLPGLARPVGGMLLAMKAHRRRSGSYADVPEVGMIVPKGHLMSRARPNDREEASGTDLAHQFEHLSVIKPLGGGRSLRFVLVKPSHFSLPADRADRVGLAPIAEDRDDLRFVTSKRLTRPYLDTEPGLADMPARITQAVTGLLDDGAGLVVLPELVTPAGAEVDLSNALRARGSVVSPGLILLGSGATMDTDPDVGRPHNEAVLMTAAGRVLLRQRKLHLFNMAAGRMVDCGIAPEPGCDGKAHLEDAAPGRELVICELDGLGRIMILICEDLQQQSPGGDVALEVRPDWILTPVLDISQTEGRWTHARAIEIGRKTLSRVVVSCSGTLGVRKAKVARLRDAVPLVNIGICYDGHANDRTLLVPGTGSLSPDRTVVAWESATWPRHLTSLGPKTGA